ncbi:MAG TPA: endonuclease MutS2, partial [Dehalococcoidia bacterium]|nr:endonuclease MutS2 [Dehalococcoidia bacterium]
MDSKSLEILEFPQIRRILAEFTSFSASAKLALTLQPLSDYERISLLLGQSAEGRRLLSLDPLLSAEGVLDVRETVKMAALGKVLEPQNLVEIRRTLGAMRGLRASVSRSSDKLPLLWTVVQGITELRGTEENIARCIDPTGGVMDSASPKLARVRQEARETRRELLRQLDDIMRTEGQELIQDHLIVERAGRYVIPVRFELRKQMRGIVHDVSNSGATAFIEPWATVELGNTLRELATEEQREIERILAELSAEVGRRAEEISRSIELAAELDLAMAKARYASRARATEPRLVDFSRREAASGEPGGVLRLVEARHPLLGKKPVPLSVEIGRDFSILVITGPNTGGKTVALKTIGLLSLMTQAGLPIPASEQTCIPVFDAVFADIGDEQSIEQTLSTFSWHMGNIVRIIGKATDRSLVLLDELGTSTDPGEGSALARAILSHFLVRGTMAVATTHHTDLKVFAHVTPGLQNASLDFDPVTFEPTYHLVVGVSGGSNALATALRLGLAPEIVADAKAMLAKGSQDLETLLANLREEQRKVEALRSDLEKQKDTAERQSVELANKLQQLAAEEQSFVQETHDSVVREAAELTREIRRAIADLRKERSKARIEQAGRDMAAIRQRLESELWAKGVQEPGGTGADTAGINVGDTVWLREANVRATVLSVSQKARQVEIQVGQARMKLGLD